MTSVRAVIVVTASFTACADETLEELPPNRAGAVSKEALRGVWYHQATIVGAEPDVALRRFVEGMSHAEEGCFLHIHDGRTHLALHG